jgi:hypothetical protein
MALTKTDSNEIEKLVRSEIKNFMKTNQILDVISKEVKQELNNKKYDDRIIDLSSKIVVELFKTMWQRKSFWEDAIKKVK